MKSPTAQCLMIAIIFVLGTKELHAQICPSGCAPDIQPGCNCSSTIHVSFYDGGFSNAAQDAIFQGFDAWNSYFADNNVPGGFVHVADNSPYADTIIYLDQTLRGSNVVASASFGPGWIRVNPDYLGDIGALSAIAAHEAGHNLCYGDVTTTSCQGSTVMYGYYNPSASASLGPCDISSLVRDYPSDNPPPPEDPHPGSAECPTSPIIINLASGEYRLTGLDSPVSFDLDGDGLVDTVGWTVPETAVAFLALDRDGDGLITTGRELFGDATLLRSSTRAPNGFVALQEFDANGDGNIDSRDAIWQSLLLWVDTNHDGISQREEIQRIASSSIASISLAHRYVGRRDGNGNLYRFEGQVKLRRGDTRPIYDVWFVVNR